MAGRLRAGLDLVRAAQCYSRACRRAEAAFADSLVGAADALLEVARRPLPLPLHDEAPTSECRDCEGGARAPSPAAAAEAVGPWGLSMVRCWPGSGSLLRKKLWRARSNAGITGCAPVPLLPPSAAIRNPPVRINPDIRNT